MGVYNFSNMVYINIVCRFHYVAKNLILCMSAVAGYSLNAQVFHKEENWCFCGSWHLNPWQYVGSLSWKWTLSNESAIVLLEGFP